MATKNSIYNFKTPMPQYFSIPSGIVYYMVCNPSSTKVIQNLYKTCKYFFSANKILVYEDGRFGYFAWPSLCPIRDKRFEDTVFTAKFWFTSELHITDLEYPKLCSILIPRIYRCNIEYLQIYCQKFSLHEFDFLNKDSKLFKISLYWTIITDDYFKPVTFDLIIGKLPYVQIFYYTSNSDEKIEYFTNQTLRNLNNFEFQKKIARFYIENMKLPSNIDLNLLFSFVKKNSASESYYNFDLHYYHPNHQIQIQEAADEMLKTLKSDEKICHLQFGIFTKSRFN